MGSFITELVENLTPSAFTNYLIDIIPWLAIIIPLQFVIGVIMSKVIKPAQNLGMEKNYEGYDDDLYLGEGGYKSSLGGNDDYDDDFVGGNNNYNDDIDDIPFY